jgi:hypothetical protein
MVRSAWTRWVGAFLVRWIDSGHGPLLGLDAVVVTAAEQAEQDRATGRRIDLVNPH